MGSLLGYGGAVAEKALNILPAVSENVSVSVKATQWNVVAPSSVMGVIEHESADYVVVSQGYTVEPKPSRYASS